MGGECACPSNPQDHQRVLIFVIVKMSAGVAPKVNLMILLHTGDKDHKRGDPPWL